MIIINRKLIYKLQFHSKNAVIFNDFLEHPTRWSTLVRIVNGPLTLFKLAEISAVTFESKRSKLEFFKIFLAIPNRLNKRKTLM